MMALINVMYERKRKGLTQQQLADKAGTTSDAISRIERGFIPKANLLYAIAKVLETTMEHLMNVPKLEQEEKEVVNQ